MRGHWIGGTRKLNKHWQNGEQGLPWSPSQPFDSIEYNGEDYVFAPAYNFEFLTQIGGSYLDLNSYSFVFENLVPKSAGDIKIASNVGLKTTVQGMGTDNIACEFWHYKMVDGVETRIVENMSAGWQSAVHHKCIRPYYDLWQLSPRTMNAFWINDLSNDRDIWPKLKAVQFDGTLNLVVDFMTGQTGDYYTTFFIDEDDGRCVLPLGQYDYGEYTSQSYLYGIGPSYQNFGGNNWGWGEHSDMKDIKAVTAGRCCGSAQWGLTNVSPSIPWFVLAGWGNTPVLWVLRRLELVEDMYWNEVTF